MTNKASQPRTFTLSDEKRIHILTTALNLFDQFGFQHISIMRIITEAKIAKQSFYMAFPSKDSFIIECLDMEISRLKQSLSNLLGQCGKDDHTSILKSFYQWHVDLAYREGYNGTLLTKAVIEYWNLPDIKMKVEDFNKWKYEIIAEYLAEEINNARLRIIVSAMNGILLPASTYLPTWEDIESLYGEQF
ncbi:MULTISPECIES: TetR/AcrR family transcriptional regulator [Acinetobacter]|jgi:AcrR family transcriptional regulator|uniref:HTH-type transcriptional repressor NemR n=2 Tax=Acinetobacter baumannii TaxID=470 RepID=A0A090BGE8_ACIBA|nr:MULTISPECIES: TetR/AcrR family transcriptional regulator [Acinetobacter]AKQ32607.1 TetR family transcriptional regulator [Acinetobacter baumannii]ALG88301.1 TetR2 [Acinetobacter baumannii]AMQ95707.1 TetR2 [Acinetobacter baumannii]ASS85446.1 TetR family transcriptional regulator [Acinetobacter baumannii]EHU1275411.1 TetR/AcrR family transcriptional regulator [Acinetobacter baumannii]